MDYGYLYLFIIGTISTYYNTYYNIIQTIRLEKTGSNFYNVIIDIVICIFNIFKLSKRTTCKGSFYYSYSML